MADDTREAELVTPAADAAPADTVVVDGIAPPDTTPGIVPDVPLGQDQGVPPVPARRGLRALLPRRSGKLTAGIVLVVAILLFTFVAPFFTQDPRSTANERFLPPSAEHLLGTNHIGNDIFAQVAYGGQGSLMVGLVAGAIALVLSIVFGIVAGYRGRFTDEALSLVTNIMLVIPGLPLIIVISAYLQTRSLLVVAVILGLTAWPGAAIVLRMQAKSLRSRDYVSAARVAGRGRRGSSSWRSSPTCSRCSRRSSSGRCSSRSSPRRACPSSGSAPRGRSRGARSSTRRAPTTP